MIEDTCRSTFSVWLPYSHIALILKPLAGDSRLQPTNNMPLHALVNTTESILSGVYSSWCCHEYNTTLLGFSVPRLGLRISYKYELRTLACCGLSPLQEKARHRNVHSRWWDANRRRRIHHFAKQPSEWESRLRQRHPHHRCSKYRVIVDWLCPYAN